MGLRTSRTKKRSQKNYIRLSILILMLLWCIILTMTPAVALSSTSTYTTKSPSRDGIGKVYLGREIARVMGYQGAGWLERSSRESQEAPSKLIAALQLQPDNIVADIGAGTGYMSFRIASQLPSGKVLAVDVQPQMLEIINYLQAEKQVKNLETILATPTNPHLEPNSIDLAVMVDVYHELEYPQEVMQAVVKALKPGGKVVLAEYRAENPLIMIKRLHKMSQRQVKKEMQAVGLTWKETKQILPQQHLMFFTKDEI